MATFNIADFKRPGIFIREIDASARQVPAQTELINLVPGFSKKGPVNKPILISTPQELFEIYGEIDRNMEKKGCFFHRTILSILRNGPVWALNLLNTDDELDQIDWLSVSTSANVENRAITQSAYADFFDRADFWERDREAFLTIADENRVDDKHIMHITNLGDKKSSVFIYKSDAAGYNQTLEDYYGGSDKVPAYLYPKDQAKDYLVEMLIVSGDWSNFQELSVDTRWSQYFNTNGLRKSQVNNFINDSAVNVLSFYGDLSLIPYFKDINDRDVFIETVVNRDTDTHGIFVSYDIDALEDTDYPTGLIDLLGHTLVNDPQESIEYISYKEVITESVSYDTVTLDRAGNSFGHCEMTGFETRYFGTPSISDVTGSGFTELTLSGITSYNLGGENITPDTTSNTVTVENVNIGKIRKDTLYLDDNGAVGIVKGFEVSNQTQWDDVPLPTIASGLLPIAIAYVGGQGTSGGLDVSSTVVLPNITCALGSGTNAADLIISYSGVNQVNWEFTGTSSSDADLNYRKTKLNMIFNQLQSNFASGVSIIKSSTGSKVVITNSEFETSATSNLEFTVTVAPSININNGLEPEIHFIDDEQIFVPSSGSTTNGMKTDTSFSTSGYGIVATGSKFYRDYVNGVINSGDYFYPDLFGYNFSKVEFFKQNGNDIVELYYDNGDLNDITKFNNRKIKIFGTELNDNVFTVLNASEVTGLSGAFDTKIVLIVNENVSTESFSSGTITVHGANETDIRYLKMYLVNNQLSVEFTQDENLIGINSLNFTPPNSADYFMNNIKVFSARSNFVQSLEIESILENNSILVNAERYGEVGIGEYLKAYVDTQNLQPGEVPRRFTRIVEKKLYAADTSLVEIKTDAAIDVINFGTDPQTFRYTEMERYVNTYQPMVLGGFKMRAASLPNGTESRQNEILNLIALNTPIFKGLINRDRISWRYLIDCWGLGLTSNSKQQLVDLCGERLTALGLLNMPSVKDFKNSQATNFVDPDTKTLRTDFIAAGGDPNSNPSFLYTFGQGKGQSNTAYFFPYCTINDNGRPLNCPPAMFITNTFMRKHTSRLASVKPWTVAAGIQNGLVTGIGNVEIDFTNEDIENLNGMNANPIVFKRNRGFVIETDNTAQVQPRSALSFTHVREVLIELEEELYQMLLTYQWRFNTPEVRAEIKSNADRICERYVRENGLFDFFNVMDETNNTPDVIDAQIGVIDTFVEPVKAMGVIVNQVTILKTGDIAAGGFRNVAA